MCILQYLIEMAALLTVARCGSFRRLSKDSHSGHVAGGIKDQSALTAIIGAPEWEREHGFCHLWAYARIVYMVYYMN